MYTVRFDEREEMPVFGHRYWFFLKDAVENVPEYVVRWDNFVRWVSDLLVVLYVSTGKFGSSQNGRRIWALC